MTEKRKRGRPPIYSPAYAAYMRGLFPEVRSERGRRDVLYRQHAFNALIDGPAYWFFDAPAIKAGNGPPKLHTCVLAELGKFDDADLIREFARQMGQQRDLTIKKAAEVLRVCRRALRNSATVAENEEQAS
jgi:hypothetical protein